MSDNPEIPFTEEEIGQATASFTKLSKLDIDKSAIENKNNLSFLAWAYAWKQLCLNYPDSTFEFLPDLIHANDTVTCKTSVTVNGKAMTMWLPVMNNRNASIQNPTSREISDSRMRCLVKCIAMHGLGINLYMKDFLWEKDLMAKNELANDKPSPAPVEPLKEEIAFDKEHGAALFKQLKEAQEDSYEALGNAWAKISATTHSVYIDQLEPVYKKLMEASVQAEQVSSND